MVRAAWQQACGVSCFAMILVYFLAQARRLFVFSSGAEGSPQNEDTGI